VKACQDLFRERHARQTESAGHLKEGTAFHKQNPGTRFECLYARVIDKVTGEVFHLIRLEIELEKPSAPGQRLAAPIWGRRNNGAQYVIFNPN
jgi:hypothetical protein